MVSSGSWITPLDSSGVPRQLSHLTFYDTEPVYDGNGTGQGVIPEPGTVLLFGGGLLGLGLYARRRTRD